MEVQHIQLLYYTKFDLVKRDSFPPVTLCIQVNHRSISNYANYQNLSQTTSLQEPFNHILDK
jgi:hypothetical protein